MALASFLLAPVAGRIVGSRGVRIPLYTAGICMVVFGEYPVYAIFLCMKGIKAGLKLNDDKDHHTYSYTHGQAGDIDGGITFIAGQIAARYFKIVFEHKIAVKFLPEPLRPGFMG